MPIQAISAGDVNRITLGQVITDVRAVLKELVENALDANASSVEVLLDDYGIERISVADNGHGIDPEDFAGLCLRSHTSKISLLADLLLLSTLGFRGEALHSLCTVAREVKVTTVRDQKLHELTYDNTGNLANQTTKPTRQAPGTTVVVSGLFHNLPVRLKHLKKLALSELRKAVMFLNNYVIINPHTKFTVSHTNNGKKLLVVLSRGGPTQTVLTGLLSVFGKNGAKGLSEVDINAGDVTITGYISNFSFGCGARLAADRQFLYVNRRPVANKRLVKVINEVYHQFNNAQHPVFVLDLTIPPAIVDVNLTPDKTKVMINRENDLLEDVREALRQFYDQQGGITIPRGEFADTLMSFDARDQLPTSEVDTLNILGKLGLFVDSETPSSPQASSQAVPQSLSPPPKLNVRNEEPPTSSPPRQHASYIVEPVTYEILERSNVTTPHENNGEDEKRGDNFDDNDDDVDDDANDDANDKGDNNDDDNGDESQVVGHVVIGGGNSGTPQLMMGRDGNIIWATDTSLRPLTQEKTHLNEGGYGQANDGDSELDDSEVDDSEVDDSEVDEDEVDESRVDDSQHDGGDDLYGALRELLGPPSGKNDNNDDDINKESDQFDAGPTVIELFPEWKKVKAVKFNGAIDEDVVYGGQAKLTVGSDGYLVREADGFIDDAGRLNSGGDEEEYNNEIVDVYDKDAPILKKVVDDNDPKFLKTVEWAPLDHRLIIRDMSMLNPDQIRLMNLFDLPLIECELEVCAFLNEMRNTRSKDEWIGFKHLACLFYARKTGFKEYHYKMNVPWELPVSNSSDEEGEYYYNGFTGKLVKTDYRERMIDDPSSEEEPEPKMKFKQRKTLFESFVTQKPFTSAFYHSYRKKEDKQSPLLFLPKILTKNNHAEVEGEDIVFAEAQDENSDKAQLNEDEEGNSDSQKSLSDFIHQPYGENLVEDSYGKNFNPVRTHDIEVRIGDHVHWAPTLERRRPKTSPPQKKKLSTVGWLFGKSTWETKAAEIATQQASAPEAHDVVNQDTSMLSLYIVSKSDFEQMQVIGQFNLGFILVRSKDDNMFIIDQHASNEKYNFELLSNKYHAPSQLLVLPLTVQLTAVDEILVKEKLHIFKLNGFGVKFDADQPPGQRVKLMLMPLLKQENQLYTVDDFYELLALIAENPHNKSVRPLKVRRQLAMKACRLSIMIGASLTRNRMEEVVKSLATLDKPWNCPHGRPTMRHLVELARWKSNNFPDYALEL